MQAGGRCPLVQGRRATLFQAWFQKYNWRHLLQHHRSHASWARWFYCRLRCRGWPKVFDSQKLLGWARISCVFVEVKTKFKLRAIATAPLQLTPGLRKSGKLPLRPNKPTKRTIKLSIPSSKQFLTQPQRRISSFNSVKRTMVFHLLNSATIFYAFICQSESS